jgi:hypothetical protein
MAAAYGAVFTVVAGGVAAIGVAGLWAVMFPSLRKAKRLEVPDAAALDVDAKAGQQ